MPRRNSSAGPREVGQCKMAHAGPLVIVERKPGRRYRSPAVDDTLDELVEKAKSAQERGDVAESEKLHQRALVLVRKLRIEKAWSKR